MVLSSAQSRLLMPVGSIRQYHAAEGDLPGSPFWLSISSIPVVVHEETSAKVLGGDETSSPVRNTRVAGEVRDKC